ncbi:MAG TPA: DEAD/DEAH box helicase, partial [Burkholderiales bacterium]|nr:DEAD/DEAH box helicase [Burkholderiales bacterium]
MILPFVRELLADAEKSPAFQRAAAALKSTLQEGVGAVPGGISVSPARPQLAGLTPTARALLVALLHRTVGKPILYIVPRGRTADEMTPIVQAFCELTGAADPAAVLCLPAYDVLPYENQSPHPEIQEQQATALWKMATGTAQIVLMPAVAATMRLRERDFYAGLARLVRRGEILDIDSLVAHLNVVGYTRTDTVEMPGEYGVRGGILDVYPPDAERPLRIELFGDEVESIRHFDPATQRSVGGAVEEAALLPLTPTPVSEEMLGAIHARLSGQRVSGSEEMIEQSVVESGVSVFPGWELYAPLAGSPATIFDIMPGAFVLAEEPGDIKSELDHWWERVTNAHERSLVGQLAKPEELYVSPDGWWSALRKRPGAELEQLGLVAATEEPTGESPAPPPSQQIQFLSQPTTRFHGSVPAMVEEIKKLTAENQRVMFCAPNTGELERLADIFTEYNVPFRLGTRAPRPGETYVEETSYFGGDFAATALVRGFVPDGVALPDVALVIFGTRDLFDEPEGVVVARPLRTKSKVSTFLSDFRDLAIGDFVVHVEHGIGEYQGLKEIPQADGATAEFMVLEYAEGARLYVPLTRLDLVQKYRSAEGARPALSRLGTQAWAKTKARVKKAMKDMADELLKLYAARKTAQGHTFPADTEWQREFEDAFEFNETEDQAQAIDDVKRDMQTQQPMDRLLCGDVGYGKTEVAMRAAFKAVSDNKQVAVLAPTTVLAFQHFETFKRRMAAFPIKIEMISRFRTTKQQKEIVAKVEAGQVDILIGTHRLLSKDIKFHELGLVVVDEEQRFGVRHKERLKQLKKEVDVLTMSATPIPRTLHMSLVGLRDMS